MCAQFVINNDPGKQNVTIKMDAHHVPIRQSAEGKVRGKGREEVNGVENEESESVDERPSVVDERPKGQEELRPEVLDKIQPTDPLRLVNTLNSWVSWGEKKVL